jgi:hypothetical protein
MDRAVMDRPGWAEARRVSGWDNVPAVIPGIIWRENSLRGQALPPAYRVDKTGLLKAVPAEEIKALPGVEVAALPGRVVDMAQSLAGRLGHPGLQREEIEA